MHKIGILISSVRARGPLFIVLAGFLAVGLVYDTVTPVFETGDEPFHYAVIKHLADGHGLPAQDSQQPQAWNQEGSQPPLYYLLGALATFWIDTGDFADRLRRNPHATMGIPVYGSNDNRNIMVHTPAEQFPYQRTTLAVHLLRWLSLLMGAGTIYATDQLARQITKHRMASVLAAMVVAFNPTFLFVSTSVNNDSLIILLATLILLQMIRVWQYGATHSSIIRLGVLAGLASLSKLSALGLIVVATLLVLIRSMRSASEVPGRFSQPLATVDFKTMLSGVVGLLTPVALIGSWWYARNVFLYGDPTGLNVMLAIVGARPGEQPIWQILQSEAEGLWLSFWGMFGWFNILAAPWIYSLFNLLTIGALLGLAFLLTDVKRITTEARSIGALWWLAFWLLILFVSWARWTLMTPATQGRLLFPAISVAAIFLSIGLVALIPRALTQAGVILLGLILFAVALRIAVLDIAPAYTPAPLVASVPPVAAREPIHFGNALELVGVELPRASAHPGEALSMTLYWKAATPMNQDYSIFVHLVDSADLHDAQRDTYPGLGLRPTTQLQPGDIVRDVYSMSIDAAALAPGRRQWRVGVYDVATGKRLSATIQGQPAGDNPLIGDIELLPISTDSAMTPLRFSIEDHFELRGYQIDRVAIRAGETFRLTLYWQAHKPAPKDYSIFTHVLRQDETLWGQLDRQLPTTTWQAGQIVEDTYVIQVKPETPAGVYEIEVGAYDLTDNLKRLNIWDSKGQFAGDRVLLRKIRVLAP
ncbi:MAG: DUF2142 domain-containing protein [Chloroflexi bacterium]|nr:DUF2142 domain-containing protein [Chloroflexota bacterium]